MPERIKRFSESEINSKIKSKVSKFRIPGRKRSPHPTFVISLNGKVVGKVKVPNDHDRLFSKSKSEIIAHALKLTYEEYNKLIECSLTRTGYYEILASRLNSAPA